MCCSCGNYYVLPYQVRMLISGYIERVEVPTAGYLNPGKT
jgi:hypothetical protein